ncbi:MAG TPA: primosomal protein N' [Bryobacteraceae bacterium]|nr:primosomal protein N' [Bryobacteraceae bacterium]
MTSCEVSLPVPLDRAFTYSLPLTLEHRVKPGARVLVPFGTRKLTGVVIDVHAPAGASGPLKDVLRLFDEHPVLDAELLSLGRWMANYYCAPLGEVLRSMLPLASATRSGKTYSLTSAGRDAARQLSIAPESEDTTSQLLGLLAERSLSEAYIKKKLPLAGRALKSLEKRGWLIAEQTTHERDPLRAPSQNLRVALANAEPATKLPKAERELLAYLSLHPGTHNLAELEPIVKNASPAARSLARKQLVSLAPEPVFIKSAPIRAPHDLNAAQRAAFDLIAAGIESRKFCTFLLHGVTGSGKTEVYLNAIDTTLAAGRSALLLVPEIALTPAVAGQFYARFGDRVAILHSAFSDSERDGQWRRIRDGGASVVVGTRSGVFAPVRNLGLIVVDEEHDASYKQEENPRYNGRDVAIVRAQAAGACVVLGSATPSLESRFNAASFDGKPGKYTLLELPDRIANRPLPEVRVVDMRQEFLETRKHAIFSRAFIEAIRERLSNHEQAMVLLNRRGFATFVACRACGERVECVNCSVTLTWHKRDRRLLCHYCGYAEKVPSVCPKCESEHIQFMGSGSERVEDELHGEFPEARIARLDRDTVTGKRHFEDILSNFRERNFDILVGTQMIAKGHDIPNVTLVGIVSADVGIGMPDFRAAERTFQILTQVAGRAGRGDIPGLVILQTINPDHYAIRFAANQDYTGFYEKELQFRRFMKYPPFAAMANILVRAAKQEEALRMSTELGNHLTPPPPDMKVMGPAEAPVPRLKAEYRYQLLIKSGSRKALNELLRRARDYARAQKWSATALVIDVDPLTLL